MLKEKLYNAMSKIIHLFIPTMILLSSIVELLTYNKVDDPGGWGGLGIFACITISVIWFIVSLLMGLIKKRTLTNGVIKIVLSIISLIIFYNNMYFLIGSNINELIILIDIILIVIFTLLLVLNKKNMTNK